MKATNFSFHPSFKKRTGLILALVLVAYSCLYSQNQSMSDSLELIYKSGEYDKKDFLKLLTSLASNHPDPELSLKYSEELIKQAKMQDSIKYVFSGLLQKGNALRLKGDLNEALESYFAAATIAKQENENRDLAIVYVAMAGVYSAMGNSISAVKQYRDAIEILKEEQDSISYASALENLGDEYNLGMSKPDSALIFFEQSGKIFRAINYEPGMAYNLGNIGLAYALKGQNVRAEENIKEAIVLLDKLGDHYPICVYLTYMSDIYLEKGDKVAALEYASQSLELAERYGLKVEIRDANLKLSDLYEEFGNFRLSNQYYKNYITYRDSVKNIEYVKQMADLRADYEIAQKQVEVDLLEKESEIAQLQTKRQKFIIYATGTSLILVTLLAFGAFNRYQYIKRTNKIITEEKNRSETLLLNILPEETAHELMEKGSVKAQKFESITVLFSDFKEFTKLAEQVEPELLVNSIDFYFKKFDEITTRYGLEKIKTIGDAYMCAGGLPTVSNTHPRDVIQAAKEMIDLVKMELKSRDDLIHFEVRIGIHTGPVVAGIVGIKKWQYDIWGDTVNIASRMETNSEVGRINVSETTYQEIKDEFPCEYRGEIEVKNRGVMKMYFLS